MPDAQRREPHVLHPQFGTGIPNIARTYDYLLGDKDNQPADRAAAEQIIKRILQARRIANENRMIRYLAEDCGTRPFVDIGSGLPTGPNLLLAILHFTPDDQGAYEAVDTLRSAIAPGIYLALSHSIRTPQAVAVAEACANADLDGAPHSPAQVRRFFDDFAIVAPGLVPITAITHNRLAHQPPILGGVARKLAAGAAS